MPDCPFCTPSSSLPAMPDHPLAHIREDLYPVSPGHLLIIPNRHVANWFELSSQEQQAVMELVNQAKMRLDDTLQPDGYNIGINCGEAAGQTVMHVHCHLIPRYEGDTLEPRGGVRGVIPEKQSY
ncbi:MAG: HIT family protein [Alcanivoracaceae bacterium]|nr:HIT family protein [Alcanivoracaceae bacterium]